MPGYGYGGGSSMWGFGVLMMVGVVLVGLALWAVIATTGRGSRGPAASVISPTETGGRSRTRQLLDERYARGEVSSEEYTERLHTLGL